MKLKPYLIDDIGNRHPRKNGYLKDLSEGKKVDKKTHPYIREAEQKEAARKEFEAKLKAEEKHKMSAAKGNVIEKLKVRLDSAQKRAKFYEPRADFSYDDELRYKENLVRLKNLPGMIEEESRIKRELKATKEGLEKAKTTDFTKLRAEIKEDIERLNKAYEAEIQNFKDLKNKHQISPKAYRNEKREAKLRLKENIRSAKLKDPEIELKGELKKLKHQEKTHLKSAIRVMDSDIADLRRKTPVETEKQIPWYSIVSAPLPGLGQLLNGQPLKALFFFFGTLFNYLVAIPYAMGEGNYRGEGIKGLITLAEGGKRLDRSIIFMIEGILSIVLLLIATAIFILAFKDTRKVEKKKSQGIRPHNRFETLQFLSEGGFPYLVSLPALLLILFIVIVPILTTIFISFTNYDPQHQSKFVWTGLLNYKQIVLGQGMAGGPFWLILGWTLIWTLCATSLAIFIGFFFALVLNQDRIRGKKFFRTVYLLPWAVPAFITIMFFSIMLAPGGPLTELINGVFGTALNVKNSTWGTRIALILLQGWLGSSYIFLLSTGVLQGISHELYEAAEIDGATGLQRTFKITIPLVLYQTAPLMVGQYTFNFNNFSIIYLFNGGGPFNPTKYGNLAGSSDLLISYIYKLTIEKQYQGMGAAITLLVSIALMFFAWIGFRNSKAFREESL